MSENIKEAIAYGVELASREEKVITVNDKKYYDSQKNRLVELEPTKYPETIMLNTLDSLIDYLKSERDSMPYRRLIVIVKSPIEIKVYEELNFEQRRTELVYVEALTPRVQFNKYYSTQEFNVYLQSLFVNDNDRDVVINFASALKIDNGQEITDDGISQTATIKTGVASLSKAKAPNHVILRPYRTFSEVEQPASPFVFRIDSNANMALFEADGGKWRLEAVNNIADYLKEALADNENITILA